MPIGAHDNADGRAAFLARIRAFFGQNHAPTARRSKMLPRVYIAHHIPGRLRIRIPTARSNSALLQKLSELAQSVPGVERIECSQLTGSLLIHYSADAYKNFESWLSLNGDSTFALVKDGTT